MNRLALVIAYAAGVFAGTLTALWLIWRQEVAPEPAPALPDPEPETSSFDAYLAELLERDDVRIVHVRRPEERP